MLKTVPNFVLSRPSPCDVPKTVRLSRRTPCGLVGKPFWASFRFRCGLALGTVRVGAPGLGGWENSRL